MFSYDVISYIDTYILPQVQYNCIEHKNESITIHFMHEYIRIGLTSCEKNNWTEILIITVRIIH